MATTARCCGTTSSSPRRRSAGDRSSRSRWASRSPSRCTSPARCARGAYPLLVASQAVPIVDRRAAARRLVRLRDLPKLAIIALVCFFPVVVTTLDALRSIDPDQLKLLRTLDASRWQAFRCAEAPAALPGRAQRRQDRRRGGRDRRRLRRVRRLQRGPRPPHPAGHPPARDRPRLRRRRRCSPRSPSPSSPPSALAERRLAPWAHPTQRTSDPVTRRLLPAVLALVAAARARRLRRARGADRPPPADERCADARLLPQRRPRRDLRREGDGRVRARRASTSGRRRRRIPAPLKLLAAGRVDLAISYEPEVLLARDQGQQARRGRALVQQPLTSIMSVGSGDRAPQRSSRARPSAPPASPTSPPT